MRKLIKDYYAAITWLHLDFAVGIDDSHEYMDELMHQWMKLPLTNEAIDTLDEAWEQSELANNYTHFERALTRVLRRTNHA